MFNVIVVEDIRREREGIIKSVRWGLMETAVVASAENGLQALEHIKTLQPDIIVTDIEMPLMDGIELARRVREFYPTIKIIFLTSHSNFEYAKKAVNLDITSYVLKPANPMEMEAALKKAVDMCKIEKTNSEERERLSRQLKESLPVLREKFLRDLLAGVYSKEDEIWSKITFFGLNIIPACYSLALLEIDDFQLLYDELDEESKQLALLDTYNKSRSIVSGYPDCFFIDLPAPRFAVLLQMQTYADQEVESLAYSRFSALHEEISQTLKMSVSIGISKTASSLTSIPRLFNQAGYILKFKLTTGKSSILVFNDFNQNEDIRIKMEEIHNNLKLILTSGSSEDVGNFVDDIFHDLENNRNISSKFVQNICLHLLTYTQSTLLEFNESFDSILGSLDVPLQKLLRFETIVDIKQWLKNILNLASQHIQKVNNSKSKKLIEQIKDIISQSYCMDITTNDIARKVYLSSNYVNSIFKSEVGMTIPDYLTKFRINAAKELLKNSAVKVYEVGEMVGYKDKSYFSQIFKTYTGITPNEYRKRV